MINYLTVLFISICS